MEFVKITRAIYIVGNLTLNGNSNAYLHIRMHIPYM